MLAMSVALGRDVFGQSEDRSSNGLATQAVRASELQNATAPASTEELDVQEPVAAPVNWHNLVERIHRGEESGMEELYGLFAKGIRFYLCRHLGAQELDDKV